MCHYPIDSFPLFYLSLLFVASALSDPQNTYYLHLQIKNYNRNPVQLQYRQAGSDGSFRRIDIPALYHQWFLLPFNRIENFPMSVHFRIYDTVDRRYVTIVDYGGMYLWQPSSRYSTEQLTVGNTSKLDLFTL